MYPGKKSSSKILFYKSESSCAVPMPQLHCQIGDSDHPQSHRQRPFYTDLKKRKKERKTAFS